VRFADAPDGGILVYDGASGRARRARAARRRRLPARRAAGDGPRALLADVGPELPFVLTRWSDGRLTLDDSVTRMHVAVSAFGPTQVESFERVFAMAAGAASVSRSPPRARAGSGGAPPTGPAPPGRYRAAGAARSPSARSTVWHATSRPARTRR
jgi:hypothetical protein